MEYQYRHGGRLPDVTRQLWTEGGVKRFYRGLAPALVLAPVCRFGDTTANELALASLGSAVLRCRTRRAGYGSEWAGGPVGPSGQQRRGGRLRRLRCGRVAVGERVESS